MAETTAELIAQGKDVTKTLTDPERMRLEECEQIIRKGLGTFLAVGRALAEIHDNRLYRETHNDFRPYCKDVWDLGKSTAYQKMDGYRAVKLLEDKMSAIADISDDDKSSAIAELSEGGSTSNDIVLPLNEYQTKPLAKLKKDPDALLKAWSIVQQTLKENPKAKLTGALVKKAVREVKGEKQKKRNGKKTKELESTERLSPLFKKQCQVMADVVMEERNNRWQTTSKKQAVKWLGYLLSLTEEE